MKNGRLPNPGLREISTIGGTTHDGQKPLIVVLREDNETEDGGIDLVQQITQTAANAIPATDPCERKARARDGEASRRACNVALLAIGVPRGERRGSSWPG